jgi:Domain of unknown function (DUF4276)
MVAKKHHLIIEGTSTTDNGDLRQGFVALLNKDAKARGNFTLEMGNGIDKTAWAFIKKRQSGLDNHLLLIDSDCPSEQLFETLQGLKLQPYQHEVFFMIQEMEAWFLSQPEVLEQFYGKGVTKKLTKKHASLFLNPKEELKAITKDSKRGPYQIVKHATALLKELDNITLARDFEDFRRLLETISSK